MSSRQDMPAHRRSEESNFDSRDHPSLTQVRSSNTHFSGLDLNLCRIHGNTAPRSTCGRPPHISRVRSSIHDLSSSVNGSCNDQVTTHDYDRQSRIFQSEILKCNQQPQQPREKDVYLQNRSICCSRTQDKKRMHAVACLQIVESRIDPNRAEDRRTATGKNRFQDISNTPGIATVPKGDRTIQRCVKKVRFSSNQEQAVIATFPENHDPSEDATLLHCCNETRKDIDTQTPVSKNVTNAPNDIASSTGLVPCRGRSVRPSDLPLLRLAQSLLFESTPGEPLRVNAVGSVMPLFSPRKHHSQTNLVFSVEQDLSYTIRAKACPRSYARSHDDDGAAQSKQSQLLCPLCSAETKRLAKVRRDLGRIVKRKAETGTRLSTLPRATVF